MSGLTGGGLPTSTKRTRRIRIQVDEVRPPRSAQDLARAIFTHADRKRTRRGA
ncbi:MAG: hypothetical protein OXF41_02565 [bacterium]|nr:hypothetical protein [bacterium]